MPNIAQRVGTFGTSSAHSDGREQTPSSGSDLTNRQTPGQIHTQAQQDKSHMNRLKSSTMQRTALERELESKLNKVKHAEEMSKATEKLQQTQVSLLKFLTKNAIQSGLSGYDNFNYQYVNHIFPNNHTFPPNKFLPRISASLNPLMFCARPILCPKTLRLRFV